MGQKTVREYRKMFEELGVEFEEKRTGDGHIQYTVAHMGKARKFTFAFSPSDHRNLKNNRAAIARFKREAEGQ